jgi:hypothetical protein
MPSNCTQAGRLPVTWVQEGKARLLVHRETVSDLLARDVGL